MIHLLMKFLEDTPVFTGLVFARGSMASRVADYRNKAVDGFHFIAEFPVDTSEDYDGSDDVPQGIEEAWLVIGNDTKEDAIVSVHTDSDAAEMVVEAKTELNQTWGYRVQYVKVHHGYPPDSGDAFSCAEV